MLPSKFYCDIHVARGISSHIGTLLNIYMDFCRKGSHATLSKQDDFTSAPKCNARRFLERLPFYSVKTVQ